ncbi:MAG: DUF393 domain-containing protein [Pseudomonadota bacterium]
MTQTVLYNGSCPVCRAEIEHYQRLAGPGSGLAWQDISDSPADVAGADGEALRRRLHVMDGDKMLVGVPAFARIWEDLPRYRWLAALVRLPLVRTFARWLYEPIAAGLYAWDRRRRRGATVDPTAT